MKFSYYQDPGHGWVKVQRKLLADLGILNQITGCSYQHGKFVYLEEDCDAGLFFKAFEKQNGSKPETVSKHTNKRSRIRGYQRFSVNHPPVLAGEVATGLKVTVHGKPFVVIGAYGRDWAIQCEESGINYSAKLNALTHRGEK